MEESLPQTIPTILKQQQQQHKATLYSSLGTSNAIPLRDLNARREEEEEKENASLANDDRPRMKSECVFYCQYAALLIVILACLYNLTFRADEQNAGIWNSLLAASLGIILPNPSIKRQ